MYLLQVKCGPSRYTTDVVDDGEWARERRDAWSAGFYARIFPAAEIDKRDSDDERARARAVGRQHTAATGDRFLKSNERFLVATM